MIDNRIICRLCVDTSDEHEAERVASLAKAVLAEHGRICKADTRRYWKIPDCFEMLFVLQPAVTTKAVFTNILTALATGWEVHAFRNGSDWAVWNPSCDAAFTLPSVRWAHVECSRETAPPEDGAMK